MGYGPAGSDGTADRSDLARTPEPSAAGNGTSNSTLAIRGCTGYSVQAPVPWDDVAEALPEGFEPATWLGTPDGVAAQVFIDGWTCERSSIDDRSTGPVTLIFAKVEVVPPSDLAPDGEARSYIPLFATADVAAVADRLSSWRLPAHEGAPAVDGTGGGPLHTGGVQGEAGNVSVRTRVVLAQTPPTTPTFDGDTSRYFALDPPLFHGDTPQVTGIIDRETNTTTGTIGEGQFAWTGDGPAAALQPAGPGLGFDTRDGRWAETFRWRSLR